MHVPTVILATRANDSQRRAAAEGRTGPEPPVERKLRGKFLGLLVEKARLVSNL
jgi:hypothetical protein